MLLGGTEGDPCPAARDGDGGTRPYPGRADDLPQVDVHPVVAAHQVPVVRLPVLQLHQLQETGVTGRWAGPGTGTCPPPPPPPGVTRTAPASLRPTGAVPRCRY